MDSELYNKCARITNRINFETFPWWCSHHWVSRSKIVVSKLSHNLLLERQVQANEFHNSGKKSFFNSKQIFGNYKLLLSCCVSHSCVSKADKNTVVIYSNLARSVLCAQNPPLWLNSRWQRRHIVFVNVRRLPFSKITTTQIQLQHMHVHLQPLKVPTYDNSRH